MPNQPCWCGSRSKYKKCHKAYDEAPADRKYAEAQRMYARSWAITSALQYERGDYDWMADQLAPYEIERLFDVGCGSGHGVLALMKRSRPPGRIVSIDENVHCLHIAKETLGLAGLQSHVVARLDCRLTATGFVQDAKPMPYPIPKPVALVEADPMTDPHLERALLEEGAFDAVTIWLTGAHMMRKDNAAVRALDIRNEHQLRVFLQNDVYELADRILRPGGLLQVVDRAEAPSTDALREVVMQGHREQAEPTTLEVQTVAYRSWSPPDGGATKMIGTTLQGRAEHNPEMALISVLSIKR